jgi:hypothetical protein
MTSEIEQLIRRVRIITIKKAAEIIEKLAAD